MASTHPLSLTLAELKALHLHPEGLHKARRLFPSVTARITLAQARAAGMTVAELQWVLWQLGSRDAVVRRQVTGAIVAYANRVLPIVDDSGSRDMLREALNAANAHARGEIDSFRRDAIRDETEAYCGEGPSAARRVACAIWHALSDEFDEVVFHAPGCAIDALVADFAGSTGSISTEEIARRIYASEEKHLYDVLMHHLGEGEEPSVSISTPPNLPAARLHEHAA